MRAFVLTRSHCRGFSLLEMIFVTVMVSLITSLVALLFNRGTEIYRHGESHIELQRSGRHLVERVTPIIAAMCDRDDVSTVPVLRLDSSPPQLLPSNTPQDQLLFYTTEDWFAIGYPTLTTSATLAVSPKTLGKFLYRIRKVTQASDRNYGNVVLERLESPVPPYVVTPQARDNTRVLLRAKEGEKIEDLSFSLPSSGSASDAAMLRMSFTTVRTDVRVSTAGKLDTKEGFVYKFRLTNALNG